MTKREKRFIRKTRQRLLALEEAKGERGDAALRHVPHRALFKARARLRKHLKSSPDATLKTLRVVLAAGGMKDIPAADEALVETLLNSESALGYLQKGVFKVDASTQFP